MLQSRLPFARRADFCKNKLAARLFQLMSTKKTNLAVSADVTQAEALITIAEELGDEICILKTHIDILEDFSLDCIDELCHLAKQYQFLLFEDRKFADIGNTVKQQYQNGIYHIADWADIVNAHTLPGPGIISGLAEVGIAKARGLLLLAEMSSADNLFTPEYTQKTIEMAAQFPEFVMGFIAQHKLSADPQWIYMTPGVQLAEGKDALGQQYITPEMAITHNQSDVIIVGRGIIQAKDRQAEAKKYRERGWQAYLNAITAS